jgi:hypothetical protein
LKQPFERKGHAPEGTYPRSLRPEPSFREALGSCVFSLAVVIGLTTDDRRLVFGSHEHTDNNADSLNYERESPRKSVAGEARVLRVEQELGGLGGCGGKGVGRAVGEASPEPQNERRCGGGDRR